MDRTRRSRRTLVASFFALGALGAGCATSPASLEEVLTPPGTSAKPAGATLLAQFDAEAEAGRALAVANPDDQPAQVAAARSLFLASELRSERALRAAIATDPPRDLAALLELEEVIDEPTRREMLALASAGADFAKRAIEIDPHDAAARHYLGLHLATTARVQGTMASLMEGLGPRLDDATKAAVEADPSFSSGAPLVLRGRFLDRAPWPYGDREAALAHLVDAEARGARLPCILFLGDAYWSAGRTAEARAAWRRAVVLVADSESVLAQMQAERAQMRLDLLPL